MRLTRNLFILLFCLGCLPLKAQSNKQKTGTETSLVTGVKNFDYYGKEEEERMKVSLTSKDHKTAKKSETNGKQVLYYIRDSKSILFGNRCAEQVWKDYHIRYIIIPGTQKMSEAKFRSHNFKSSFSLFFLNGFGWKKKMNNELIECRRMSGEIIDN